jgi:beta-N-acetylhexosaminidase
MAVGEGTAPLPGNLALGAAGSADLAFRAGEVLGTELAAMGININFAPCCDVNSNPQNPAIGTRSFGELPLKVAELSAALVEGIQSCGVAATAKHFPGHGDTSVDSHHGLAVLPHGLDRLRDVEIPPFRAAISAGVQGIMAGHLAFPAADGGEARPATLSSSVLKGLLRAELGFDGLIVSDAMDMGAIRQGENLGEQAVRAVEAGIDLILMGADPEDQARAYSALAGAARGGRLDPLEHSTTLNRLRSLRNWLQPASQPSLSVVGCREHLDLAAEIAGRSLTLVRDMEGRLPLGLTPGGRAAVIIPRPVDLTPADTSSYTTPALARAMRRYHSQVDEFTLPHTPSPQDIAAILERIPEYEGVVLGTINAWTQPAQAALVREVIRTGARTVVIAMRMPYDLAAFPEAGTFICTYGILESSMEALAKALWGRAGFPGRLPVSIPGMYPVGHGEGMA